MIKDVKYILDYYNDVNYHITEFFSIGLCKHWGICTNSNVGNLIIYKIPNTLLNRLVYDMFVYHHGKDPYA